MNWQRWIQRMKFENDGYTAATIPALIKNVGPIIKKIRLEKELLLKDITNKTLIDEKRLFAIETPLILSGEEPTLTEVVLICWALEINVDDLIYLCFTKDWVEP